MIESYLITIRTTKMTKKVLSTSSHLRHHRIHPPRHCRFRSGYCYWDSSRCSIVASTSDIMTHLYLAELISDVVKTLMVETETWKKFESKTRDQDLKKFSRSRLGEFVRDRDETSRPEILEAKLIRIDY